MKNKKEEKLISFIGILSLIPIVLILTNLPDTLWIYTFPFIGIGGIFLGTYINNHYSRSDEEIDFEEVKKIMLSSEQEFYDGTNVYEGSTFVKIIEDKAEDYYFYKDSKDNVSWISKDEAVKELKTSLHIMYGYLIVIIIVSALALLLKLV